MNKPNPKAVKGDVNKIEITKEKRKENTSETKNWLFEKPTDNWQTFFQINLLRKKKLKLIKLKGNGSNYNIY